MTPPYRGYWKEREYANSGRPEPEFLQKLIFSCHRLYRPGESGFFSAPGKDLFRYRDDPPAVQEQVEEDEKPK